MRNDNSDVDVQARQQRAILRAPHHSAAIYMNRLLIYRWHQGDLGLNPARTSHKQRPHCHTGLDEKYIRRQRDQLLCVGLCANGVAVRRDSS